MALGGIIPLIPAIATAWPALLPILAAAAGTMGYGVLREEDFTRIELRNRMNNVELVLPNTEVISQTLGTESEVLFHKEDITVGIQVDIRGKCKIKVWGPRTQTQLQEVGTKLAQEIIKQYVYNKITKELPQKGFSIVNENTDEKDSLHLQIRRWR